MFFMANINSINAYHIGGGQVDAEAAGPGGQHEEELFAPRRIVLVNGLLTVLMRSVSVQSTILKALPGIFTLLSLKRNQIKKNRTTNSSPPECPAFESWKRKSKHGSLKTVIF